jgi:hypothetical protein
MLSSLFALSDMRRANCQENKLLSHSNTLQEPAVFFLKSIGVLTDPNASCWRSSSLLLAWPTGLRHQVKPLALNSYKAPLSRPPHVAVAAPGKILKGLSNRTNALRADHLRHERAHLGSRKQANVSGDVHGCTCTNLLLAQPWLTLIGLLTRKSVCASPPRHTAPEPDGSPTAKGGWLPTGWIPHSTAQQLDIVSEWGSEIADRSEEKKVRNAISPCCGHRVRAQDRHVDHHVDHQLQRGCESDKRAISMPRISIYWNLNCHIRNPRMTR